MPKYEPHNDKHVTISKSRARTQPSLNRKFAREVREEVLYCLECNHEEVRSTDYGDWDFPESPYDY